MFHCMYKSKIQDISSFDNFLQLVYTYLISSDRYRYNLLRRFPLRETYIYLLVICCEYMNIRLRKFSMSQIKACECLDNRNYLSAKVFYVALIFPTAIVYIFAEIVLRLFIYSHV